MAWVRELVQVWRLTVRMTTRICIRIAFPLFNYPRRQLIRQRISTREDGPHILMPPTSPQRSVQISVAIAAWTSGTHSIRRLSGPHFKTRQDIALYQYPRACLFCLRYRISAVPLLLCLGSLSQTGSRKLSFDHWSKETSLWPPIWW